MRIWLGLLICITMLALLIAPVFAEEQEDEGMTGPTVSIDYIYIYCNDVIAMRNFYTDLLGMSPLEQIEGYYLCYGCGSLKFMIFAAQDPIEVIDEWNEQPGWAGGTLLRSSWSVGVPLEDLGTVAERLTSAGVPTWSAVPFWAQDSYWSFPVRDPMGNTVEVYSIVKERPVSTTWPGTE